MSFLRSGAILSTKLDRVNAAWENAIICELTGRAASGGGVIQINVKGGSYDVAVSNRRSAWV